MTWRVPAGSFERISSVAALFRAFGEHARGKLRRPSVARFYVDADTHLFALHRALETGAFTPGPFHQIVLRDPKTRLISVPSLRDRIVHHAVVAELDPYFCPGYIDQSYACLPGRGPGRAALQYLAWTRRHGFRLSMDIQRYFPSIHHETLLHGLVFPRLRDLRTRGLLKMMVRAGGLVYRTPLAVSVLGLDAHPVPEGTGMPIGSCLSQWAANLYLNGLDHYVKRELKIRGYLRYMDDFCLFSDDKGQLEEAREAIGAWLLTHRRLHVNPKRLHIRPTGEPSTFVGYRVTRGGLAPGEKMRRRMVLNVRKAAAAGPTAMARTVGSYRALFGFGSVEG